MTNISDHISLAEAIKSQTAIRRGIKNDPGPNEIKAMKLIANRIFEPLRAVKGIPIAITSFFRSILLNVAIGGSKSSQHCKGEAMDLDADVFGGWTNSEIFNWIRENCEFDQLIWEFGDDKNPDWVHVSLKETGNRGEVIRAVRHKNGVVTYIKMT